MIGSTDKLAAYPKDHPVWFQNVFARLYHNLGIDPATTVADRGGRLMALLDGDLKRPVPMALDEDDRRLGASAGDHDRIDVRPLGGQCEMG